VYNWCSSSLPCNLVCSLRVFVNNSLGLAAVTVQRLPIKSPCLWWASCRNSYLMSLSKSQSSKYLSLLCVAFRRVIIGYWYHVVFGEWEFNGGCLQAIYSLLIVNMSGCYARWCWCEWESYSGIGPLKAGRPGRVNWQILDSWCGWHASRQGNWTVVTLFNYGIYLFHAVTMSSRELGAAEWWRYVSPLTTGISEIVSTVITVTSRVVFKYMLAIEVSRLHAIASASLCLPQSPLPTSCQHYSCLSWFSTYWLFRLEFPPSSSQIYRLLHCLQIQSKISPFLWCKYLWPLAISIHAVLIGHKLCLSFLSLCMLCMTAIW